MSESVVVACPSCNTLNRYPRARLTPGPVGQQGGGKCGKCKSPLFNGHPVALTGESFEAHAVNSDLPLLVDFWASWCGPCKAMAPQFERAAGRLEPGVRFAKINTDEEQALASRFSIQGIPTLVLIKQGKEVARQSGLMDAARIEAWVAQALG